MRFSIPFIGILLAALLDYLIKERLFKRFLYPTYYDSKWDKVPNFWKDYIPGQKMFRFRWALLPNFIGCLLSIFLSFLMLANWWQSILNGVLYLYLGAINMEHILYWWIMGFVPGEPWALFDLPNKPVWMKQLSWNYWLAKAHKNTGNEVSSEEILTIFVLGIVTYIIIFYVV